MLMGALPDRFTYKQEGIDERLVLPGIAPLRLEIDPPLDSLLDTRLTLREGSDWGTEHNPKTILVVPGSSHVHHLDGAARQTYVNDS